MLYFESDQDAIDIADRYQQNGYDWHLHSVEYIAEGQKPDALPSIQLKLF